MSNRLFTLLPGGVKHNYRSDIDGLRAIACLSVVLFHAFPSLMKGGFIGVDIFFVISGFLISSILYRNLFDSNGQINIVDFYIRRIRRIFPALIFVLLACLSLGWFVLLPEEYKFLGKHSFGGAIYYNNIMLYRESSQYFNPESNTKPLLHLWSLGVEEQFYLIFPIFLFILYKIRLNFLQSLTLFTLASFLLNIISIKNDNQSAAFYLPWCRFWELSIGAILSYVICYKKDFTESVTNCLFKRTILKKITNYFYCKFSSFVDKNIYNDICSIVGFILIFFSCFFIQNDLNFPGIKATIPVLGALFIIASGKNALINKYILSNRQYETTSANVTSWIYRVNCEC